MPSYSPNGCSSAYSFSDVLLTETLRSTDPSLHSWVYKAFHMIDEKVKRGEMSWNIPPLTPQDLQNMAYNLSFKERQPSLRSVSARTAWPQEGQLPPHALASSEYPFFSENSAGNTAAYLSSTSSSPPAQLLHKNRKRPISRTFFSNPDDQQEFQLLAKGKNNDAYQSAQHLSTSFKGCSTELERKYSRDAPIPEDIRPESVLVNALHHITRQSALKEQIEGRRVALKYMSEQLKGMRQDLRVQDIRNNFSVKVYEMHARLSLESEDLGEFNQCQAALKQLYLIPSIDRSACSIAEFFCYRLVYLSLGEQFDSLSTELIHYTNLHLKRKEVKSIVHYIPRKWVLLALQIAVACDSGDTFTLSSKLSMFSVEMHYLIRIFLLKLRVRWLHTLLTGVRGKVALRVVLTALGFLPTKHTKPDGGEPQLLWLDFSLEEAEKSVHDFFDTIKLDLQKDFSLAKIMKEEKSDSSPFTLQAEHAKEVLDRYISYLSTRKDAAGGGDGMQ